MRSVPPPKMPGLIAKDRRLQLRWLLPAIFLLMAVLGAMLLAGKHGGSEDSAATISLLYGAVGVGVLLSFLLVLSVPLVYARIRHHALASTEGVFLEFRGRRMRTFEHTDALWLHAEDVHMVLGLSPRFQPKGFSAGEHALIEANTAAYSLAGLHKLTAGKTSRAAVALPRWFEFEVEKPWQRRNQVRVQAPVKYLD
jgi:hypothetical protein